MQQDGPAASFTPLKGVYSGNTSNRIGIGAGIHHRSTTLSIPLWGERGVPAVVRDNVSPGPGTRDCRRAT